jgi:Protein of unknown function (DUF499)
MEPWYKVTTPRKEVRQGRSFNPDEFAIALEQVVAGTAPEDYSDAAQFFARTCFTRALRDHTAMVLRRLSGVTGNTAPVLTLITQFGGGKTHTLTTLFHLVRSGEKAKAYTGISSLLSEAGLTVVPDGRVAVFVGNAWDPRDGRETPWIDMARQLAGDRGVEVLGQAAKTTPPGTETIGRVFEAAGAPVLILFDEVLNFLNRHRGMTESFHAFIQNLTVAMTGTTHGAAVISLPRSQVEMTDWDLQWQEKITRVVRRVSKDLIVADEAEVSEVIRRRLFEDIGKEKIRESVARAYADWCFERRAQLPSEWVAASDSTAGEGRAREYLRKRFMDCYPFHPATLSVFQRKWQALPQYQQTRGTLAMLAQWISWAYKDSYRNARREPLITLGSAPLEVPDFRSVVLGQLGESRLLAAIDADICGANSHARALDVDTKKSPLEDIHQRVATAILFESSGGQVDKVAHLPELRFALGAPETDTTSVDSAAFAIEAKAYFVRKVGSDGFQIRYQPTLKKVVNDRKASLDYSSETKAEMVKLVQNEFRLAAGVPVVPFPVDSADIQDSPRLTIVVADPEAEWTGTGALRQQVAEWTKYRGKSPRLYPGAVVWCIKKPGRDFRDKVEQWLAWKKVEKDMVSGLLGSDFEKAELSDVTKKVKDAEGDAKDEVWACYRYAVLSDNQESDGLKVIDLGAGHSSSGESLCGRVISALKTAGLLSESVGAGYIDRNWPPALKQSGAWPLTSLRQSFLNGSLTRLIDPDTVLRTKIVEFIGRGEFGLASGQTPDGTYDRLYFNEPITYDDVTFETGVFLLRKDRAKALVEGVTPSSPVPTPEPIPGPFPGSPPISGPVPPVDPGTQPLPPSVMKTLRVVGTIQPELWNRLGTKIIPKLKAGTDLSVGIDFSVKIDAGLAPGVESDLRQILEDLGLKEKVRIE